MQKIKDFFSHLFFGACAGIVGVFVALLFVTMAVDAAVAILSGIALFFADADPAKTQSGFSAFYDGAYLPALAVYATGQFCFALLRQYKAAFFFGKGLLIASGLGTLATFHFLDTYFWAPAVFLVAGTYQLWMLFYVPLDERGTQEKVLNGASTTDNERNSDEIRHRAVKPTVSFAQVVGMKAVKERLLDAGREVVNSRKNGDRPRNGILLHGEPGNGKTFFAEALAGQLKLQIIKASFGDVVSRWIGETTENVNVIFKDAVRQAPCVLFIDEIDSLIRDRGASMNDGNSEEAKTTNTLLTWLVDVRAKGVVVVAATNHLEKLDAAAIREGRFDFKIEITPPDAEAREALITTTAAKHRGITINSAAAKQAVKRWDGFSAARITAVVEEACRAAGKQGVRNVGYPDLQVALRLTQGSQGDRLPENTPRLDDILMQADQLAKLKGIAHRMQHIEEVEAIGGSVPTGLLFFGPPGTGKTLAVRALAKTTAWALKSVSGSDLMANAKKVDELVAFARENRPCILFIDEADDVLGHRGMSGGAAAALTNKLLAAIDGAKGTTPDVLWIAATNYPESIDDAALRGGRFTEKIAFVAPDVSTVAKIVRVWLSSTKAAMGREVTPDSVADLLDGESPANINAILQQAVNLMIERRAVNGGQTQVTLSDIENAKEIVKRM